MSQKTLNLGILAHVDAGKTTLTERLLYAAGVIGEIGSCIFEDRVAVPSQSKGALCISRNSEIWVIEQVVGFHSEHDPGAFPQLDALMQSQIELRKGRTAQDIPSGITELTGSRQCKCTRIEPAVGCTHSGAVGTSTRVRVTNQIWPFRNH